MPTPIDEPRAQPAALGPRWPSWIAPILAGALAVGAVGMACDTVPAEPGEPLALRWLRAFADHPVRGAAAVALLWIGLRPGRGGAARC